MKQIPLGKNGVSGKFALVNDEDYEFLMQWNWGIQKHCNTFYVYRVNPIWSNEYHNKKPHTCSKTIYMHRLLCNPKPTEQVDHKDRNGINCQKSNLRIANSILNRMNTKKPYCPFATSKYKGVSYRKQKSVRKNGEVYYRYLWVAHLELGGKEYCKSGKTEIHAAFYITSFHLSTMESLHSLIRLYLKKNNYL